MLIGRDNELKILQNAYEHGGFHVIFIGGKLGVGKSTLISEFVKDKVRICFTAEAVNDRMNLDLFGRLLPKSPQLDDWDSAFEYVAGYYGKERVVIVIDNVYNLRASCSTFSESFIKMSAECLADSGILLLLAGDCRPVEMEEVSQRLGTDSIYLNELDYLDAAAFLSGYSEEDKIRFYACLGGMPKYLAAVDTSLSFEENIGKLYFKSNGMLYTEPFVRSETDRREPLVYNSILRSIACGHNKLNSIVTYSGEEKYKVAKYLRVLVDEGVIRRTMPFGKNAENGRNGIYQIVDRSYLFWYSFVFGHQELIDGGKGEEYAKEAVFGEPMEAYVNETAFVDICQQYLERRNGARESVETGKWWDGEIPCGVIALSKENNEALIVGCKWGGKPISKDEITALRNREYPIGSDVKKQYIYLSQYETSRETKQGCMVWNADRLFNLADEE